MDANPYQFDLLDDEDGTLSYTFSSDNGAVYSVYFNIREYDHYIDTYPHLFNKGYGFGFFQMTRPIHKKKLDERINQTIENIISNFFATHGNEVVLLFHCDYSDSRQMCRDKLFTGWYNNSQEKDNYKRERYEATITETGVTHFMGFITLNSNPHLELVQLEFDACSFNLMQQKIT